MTRLSIDIPEEIVAYVALDESTLAALAYEALIVRLYAMDKIDLITADNALGITLWDFYYLLHQYREDIPELPFVNTIRNGLPQNTQATNGETPEPPLVYDENDPESLRELSRRVLREAGLLVDFSEYPLLNKIADSEPKITREEAQAIFARHPGKSLSEIILEQRGSLD